MDREECHELLCRHYVVTARSLSAPAVWAGWITIG